MGVLGVGERFRDFHLGDFDTAQARASGPLLIVFWSTGCSTSRLAIPFFDRIQSAYPGASVVGVCQEDQTTVDAYTAKEGIRFRQVSDSGLTASRLYGVTTVPTYYLTDEHGEVLLSGTSWNRDLIQDFSDRLASELDAEPARIVLEADLVPAFKPG
jgi:thiol-disulfide isomerase/thioredoxin